MTKQELSQIYWLNKEVAMWQQELERLDNQSKVKGQKITDMPKGGSRTGSKTEKQEVQHEEIREEIQTLKNNAEIERNKIRQYIREIDDSLIRQIIEYRFAECLSWEDVATKIGGSNTKESVRKALQRFLKRKEDS